MKDLTKSRLNLSKIEHGICLSASFRYFGLACGVALSLLCVCGALGNLLSIYIFSHRQNRSSVVNLLLCALSSGDCVLSLLAPPVYVVPPFWTFLCEVELPSILFIYNMSLLYIYPVTLICQSCSVWLLVCATLEQWMSVRWPLRHKQCFNRTGTSIMIVSIVLLAVVFNLSAFWELGMSTDTVLVPQLKSYPSYILWKNTVADFSLCFVAPLLALVVLNTLVYRQIVLPSRATVAMSKTDKAATTRMLLYVVLMLILCYSLSLILMLLELVQPHWFLSNLGAAVSDLSNVLAALNSSSSSVFYLILSNKYRSTAASLFRGLCKSATGHTTVTSKYSIRMLSRSDESARRIHRRHSRFSHAACGRGQKTVGKTAEKRAVRTVSMYWVKRKSC